MTKYIINSTLIFDSTIAKLTSVDCETSNTANLSAPAARCLESLIVSRGNVLNKMTLLEKSWKDYGFVVTDNSVNQVISHIRKCFQHVGFGKDIIVTVPKLGYQFNPEYRVEVHQENAAGRMECAPDENDDIPALRLAEEHQVLGLSAAKKCKLRALFHKYKMVFTAACVTSIFHFIFSLSDRLFDYLGSHDYFTHSFLSLP